MKSQLLLLGSLTLITLSGCSLNQAAPKTHHHDWIDVYNKSGNKVVSLTSRKAVAYVSDHVGMMLVIQPAINCQPDQNFNTNMSCINVGII